MKDILSKHIKAESLDVTEFFTAVVFFSHKKDFKKKYLNFN